jgi:tRNA (adenine37-N6)-methyltransferase
MGTEGVFSMQAIGFVRSPYHDTQEIPKGCGATHEAEGILEIRPDLEPGLADIEGFSHLIVIWVFHRSEGHELAGTPPTDDRPHGVFATRSPRRPNPIGLTVVELLSRQGSVLRVRGLDMLDDTPILESSRICLMFRRNGSDADGSPKQRRANVLQRSGAAVRLSARARAARKNHLPDCFAVAASSTR